MSTATDIYNRPAGLLQNLIRFNTTNPPGNEKECIDYINGLLTNAGIETAILSKDPNRPNLIAKLNGSGTAPGVLLYGHVDVVTTANQNWAYPPFDATIADNMIWGRGALDMKSGVSMLLSAFLKAKAEGFQPGGDITLAILSDEEAGGKMGAKFLVENHKDLFRNIRYALGEFGGFSFYVAGKRFYPIQVAEKKSCWIKGTVSGAGGHASSPARNGSMAKLGTVLCNLNEHRFPVHINPVVRSTFEAIAGSVPEPFSSLLKQITDPAKTDFILDQLGPQGIMFDAMLHNIANPTIVNGGDKINVIPGKIELDFDGRLLPECTPQNLIEELQNVAGKEIDFEIVDFEEGPEKPDMGWYDTLSQILKEMDPEGIPIPFLLPGSTDARFFSRIGIQTYGFLPMKLPEHFNYLSTIHAADERIPVDAVEFGTDAIYRAIQHLT